MSKKPIIIIGLEGKKIFLTIALLGILVHFTCKAIGMESSLFWSIVFSGLVVSLAAMVVIIRRHINGHYSNES